MYLCTHVLIRSLQINLDVHSITEKVRTSDASSQKFLEDFWNVPKMLKKVIRNHKNDVLRHFKVIEHISDTAFNVKTRLKKLHFSAHFELSSPS